MGFPDILSVRIQNFEKKTYKILSNCPVLQHQDDFFRLD